MLAANVKHKGWPESVLRLGGFDFSAVDEAGIIRNRAR